MKSAESDDEPQPQASTSKEAANPPKIRGGKKAEAKVKPESKKPALKGKATKSSEEPTMSATAATKTPAGRGVKRPRGAKEDVNAAKRAKVDEGRMALRGPHLASVAKDGGLVLALGQGDTGQVCSFF